MHVWIHLQGLPVTICLIGTQPLDAPPLTQFVFGSMTIRTPLKWFDTYLAVE